MIRIAPHGLAALLALGFAWCVSQTTYVTTGLQFIAPLLVVIIAHLIWMTLSGNRSSGWSQTVLLRAAITSFGIVVVTVASQILAPMPAQASGVGDALGGVLFIIFCLVIIAVVMGVAALLIYLPFKAIQWAIRAARKSKDDQLNDFGTMGVICVVLAVASFEGVPGAFSFDKSGQVSASYDVASPAGDVWASLDTATSPDFPLPELLRALPHPVAVTTDEGTMLDARRVVRFEGREGAGNLSLVVVKRNATSAVFQVTSDATPIAKWVRLDTLTYEVTPQGSGSILRVSLTYERQLSPAWFFAPFTQLGTWLAVDVLARDSAARAG